MSGPVLGCLISGVVGYGVFLLYEWRVAKIPIVPRASSQISSRLVRRSRFTNGRPAFIFKNQTVAAVFVSTFLNGATILTQVRSPLFPQPAGRRCPRSLANECSSPPPPLKVYYLPQYFQVVRGESPIGSGVLILPQLILTTVFVAISGQLVARTGEYKVRSVLVLAFTFCADALGSTQPSICVGYAMWAIGLGLLSTLDENTSVARIVGYEILNGGACLPLHVRAGCRRGESQRLTRTDLLSRLPNFSCAAGQGGTLQTSMVAAQAAVARSEMSVVTSVRNFMRSLGGTVFLVIAATIL